MCSHPPPFFSPLTPHPRYGDVSTKVFTRACQVLRLVYDAWVKNGGKARGTLAIAHAKGRAVLRSGFPSIIEPGGRDIGVAQPFLHLGDVGFVFQGVGGGGRARDVRMQCAAQLGGDP